MQNTLQVNDQQLMIKEYNGQRVVHMWDIARLHGVDVKNIRNNFDRNKKYLLDGEDYFLISKDDEFARILSTSKDVSRKALGPTKNIPLFAESGYLMMTKPMTDEISWKVQRKLVNCYFKIKEVIQKPQIQEIQPQPKSLAEVNKTIELISNLYDKMKVSNEDKVKTVSALLETAGVNLPAIDIPQKIDKTNFITIREVAERAGIYDRWSRPNIEALAIVIDELRLDFSEYKASMYLDKNNKEIYLMTFSPNLVKRISNWLYKRNYPTFLERQLNNGDIKRIMIVYKDKDFTIH